MSARKNVCPAGQPAPAVLKAIKSIHKTWARGLKSKQAGDAIVAALHVSDDAFMLAGGGMESFVKSIMGSTKDPATRKVLLSNLRAAISPCFHEETADGIEYAPSEIFVRRSLEFLKCGRAAGCTVGGTGMLLDALSSTDSGTVDLALSCYRALLAAVFSLPVASEASAAVASGLASPASPLPFLLHYLCTALDVPGLLLPQGQAGGVQAAAQGPSPTQPKMRVAAGAPAPPPSLTSLPTLLGCIEAVRLLRMCTAHAFTPSQRAHGVDSFTEIVERVLLASPPALPFPSPLYTPLCALPALVPTLSRLVLEVEGQEGRSHTALAALATIRQASAACLSDCTWMGAPAPPAALHACVVEGVSLAQGALVRRAMEREGGVAEDGQQGEARLEHTAASPALPPAPALAPAPVKPGKGAAATPSPAPLTAETTGLAEGGDGSGHSAESVVLLNGLPTLLSTADYESGGAWMVSQLGVGEERQCIATVQGGCRVVQSGPHTLLPSKEVAGGGDAPALVEQALALPHLRGLPVSRAQGYSYAMERLRQAHMSVGFALAGLLRMASAGASVGEPASHSPLATALATLLMLPTGGGGEREGALKMACLMLAGRCLEADGEVWREAACAAGVLPALASCLRNERLSVEVRRLAEGCLHVLVEVRGGGRGGEGEALPPPPSPLTVRDVSGTEVDLRTLHADGGHPSCTPLALSPGAACRAACLDLLDGVLGPDSAAGLWRTVMDVRVIADPNGAAGEDTPTPTPTPTAKTSPAPSSSAPVGKGIPKGVTGGVPGTGRDLSAEGSVGGAVEGDPLSHVSLSAGLTRAAKGGLSGPWMGTVDIALLLGEGYCPPSACEEGDGAPLPTVFDQTLPALPLPGQTALWPVWDPYSGGMPALYVMGPLRVGLDVVGVPPSSASPRNPTADDAAVQESIPGSTHAARPGTSEKTGKSAPAPAPIPVGKKGGPVPPASSLAPTPAPSAAHHTPTRPSCMAVRHVLGQGKGQPGGSHTHSQAAWESRVAGLRLLLPVLGLAAAHPECARTLLHARLAAMVARLAVDAAALAFLVPRAVHACTGPTPAPAAVEHDTLLQAAALCLQALPALVALGPAFVAQLSSLGPIVPDTILAVSLHTDVLATLPAIAQALGVYSGMGLEGDAARDAGSSFIIPVELPDPRAVLPLPWLARVGGSGCTLPEAVELRALALHVLAVFAAADATHRTFSPYTSGSGMHPLPPARSLEAVEAASAAVLMDTHRSRTGTGAAPAAAGKGAHPARPGPAVKGGGEGAALPLPADAPHVHASPGAVFRPPTQPSPGLPALGVDWDVATESSGERLALSVLRWVPLLLRALDHPVCTSGGVRTGGRAHWAEVAAHIPSPCGHVLHAGGSAVRLGLLRVIDAALTVYRARDRLAVEQIALAQALLGGLHATPSPRTHTGGGPGPCLLLSGRTAALIVGRGDGWNAGLHRMSHSPVSGGGEGGDGVRASRAGTAKDKEGGGIKGKGKVGKDAGAGGEAAQEHPSDTHVLALAARAEWRHTVEGWGELPPPCPTAAEDWGAAGHPTPVGVGLQPHPTPTDIAHCDLHFALPVSLQGQGEAPRPGPSFDLVGPTVLPTYFWPTPDDAGSTLGQLLSLRPGMDGEGATPEQDILMHLAQETVRAAQAGTSDGPASSSPHTLTDAARAVLYSHAVGALLRPLVSLARYSDPLASDPETMLGLCSLKALCSDSHRGGATQSAGAELCAAECRRQGGMLHTLCLTVLPPVPVGMGAFVHTARTAPLKALHGMRDSSPAWRRGAVEGAPTRAFLWQDCITFDSAGRDVLSAAARDLFCWLRDRGTIRASFWGRAPHPRPRPCTAEELSSLATMGSSPVWSTLHESVSVCLEEGGGGGVVTDSLWVGRDDPVYPILLDVTYPHPLSGTADGPCLPALTASLLGARAAWYSRHVMRTLGVEGIVPRLGGGCMTPLHATVSLLGDNEGTCALLAGFVAAGGDPNAVIPGTRVSPLMTALGLGKLRIAAQLVAAGADVNSRDAEGNPVLKYAFLCPRECDREGVEALEGDRQAIAVVLPGMSRYRQAVGQVRAASASATRAAAQALLPHLAESHHRTTPSALSALTMIQGTSRRFLTRRRLRAARAALSTINGTGAGSTVPLLMSHLPLNEAAVRLLVSARADVNGRDGAGNSALHWFVGGCLLLQPPMMARAAQFVPAFCAPPCAVTAPHAGSLLHCLLAAGARADLQNSKGASALHCALEIGRVDVALALVRMGASTALTDRYGCLPLHYAALGRGFGGNGVPLHKMGSSRASVHANGPAYSKDAGYGSDPQESRPASAVHAVHAPEVAHNRDHTNGSAVDDDEWRARAYACMATTADLVDPSVMPAVLPLFNKGGEGEPDTIGTVPCVRLLPPRAELFVDMVVRAVESKAIAESDVHVAARARSAAASQRRAAGGGTSAVLAGAPPQGTSLVSASVLEPLFTKEYEEEEEDPSSSSPVEHSRRVLHQLTPTDVLAYPNRYGVSVVHIAAGAGVDGGVILPPPERSRGSATSDITLPCTYTGVHPALCALARHGPDTLRLAALAIKPVSLATQGGHGSGSGRDVFITLLLAPGRAPAFVSTIASESRARADILYACLGLPQVLSGSRGVASSFDALALGDGEASRLLASQGMWDSRGLKMANRQTVSRATVQASVEEEMHAVSTHAAGLVGMRDRAGRNPLHYLCATWHAPLRDMAGASGLFGVKSGDDGLGKPLAEHYAAMARALHTVACAATGRLPVAVLRVASSPLRWRASAVALCSPLAFIPSGEDDAGGVTDVDTVPPPGVMVVRPGLWYGHGKGMGGLLGADSTVQCVSPTGYAAAHASPPAMRIYTALLAGSGEETADILASTSDLLSDVLHAYGTGAVPTVVVPTTNGGRGGAMAAVRALKGHPSNDQLPPAEREKILLFIEATGLHSHVDVMNPEDEVEDVGAGVGLVGPPKKRGRGTRRPPSVARGRAGSLSRSVR